jgi:acetyl esterase/lipase
MRGTVSKKLIPLLTQVNSGLAQAKASGAAFEPSVIRQNLENLSAYMLPGPDVESVSDIIIAMPEHSVSARIYHPAPEQALPVLLHFHGGGHMCGSVNLYDAISRELAVASHAMVICLDYRLAPEHPYPSGLNDCQYLLENYRQILKGYRHNQQLYIAGDSAGGAICTSLVMNNIANPEIHIDKQILLYPSVDYTMSCPSISENGQGFLLEADKMRWYFQQYFNVDSIDNDHNSTTLVKNASPLFNAFDRRMPKTLVITAGCDPLRDEGKLYAEKAKLAGVNVEHYQFDDLIHAYMLLSKLIPAQYRQTYNIIENFINHQ